MSRSSGNDRRGPLIASSRASIDTVPYCFSRSPTSSASDRRKARDRRGRGRAFRDGVYRADLWLGDSPKARPLETSIEKADGRRVLAIDDVAELDGRIVLLLNVASGQGEAQGEIWLLSFD